MSELDKLLSYFDKEFMDEDELLLTEVWSDV